MKTRLITISLVAVLGCAADEPSNDIQPYSGAGSYGVDYSFTHPSLDELRANGYTFVSRYLSRNPKKNITSDEAAELRANGFDIILNWEGSASAALKGYAQGVEDAQDAAAQAQSVGAPGDLPIYFSIDFDAQPAQFGAIDDYFHGITDVLGIGRVGAYGSFALLGHLFDGGTITWGWQAYAWSYGHWDPRAQARQLHNGILGGAADLDQAMVDNFGQWGFVDTGPAPHAPPIPTSCGAIDPGHGLSRGQAWSSCDGRFTLAVQGDGNVVLYSNGVATWTTGTSNAAIAVMQTDGNFVVYSDHGHALFSSSSSGNPGAWLAIQTDGNMVVYGGAGALWSTQTGGMPPAPAACGAIQPGEGLAIGAVATSCDGQYALAQQGDGNLVLYHGGSAIWWTGTTGSGARASVMQGDGNFVTYAGGTAVFNTGTGSYPGAWLAIQTDGNLVVYSGNTPVWSSGTSGR